MTTKPLDDSGETKVVTAPKSASKPEEPAEVKPTEPTVKPERPPAPKPSADEAEKKAQRLLRLGDSYMASGLRAKAKEKYAELIAKYPDTEAAKKALGKIQGL